MPDGCRARRGSTVTWNVNAEGGNLVDSPGVNDVEGAGDPASDSPDGAEDSPFGAERRSDASVGGAAAGAIVEGSRSSTRLAARVVKRVMQEIRPVRSKDLVRDASRVLADRGPTGHDGAFGQVSGKVHEHLAVYRHNHKLSNVVRRSKIRLIENSQSPIVDAVRTVRGSVVESISYKKSAAGAARAAAGTPAHVSIAVPTDQIAVADTRVGRPLGSSGVSRRVVDDTTQRGARALATTEAAGSLARAGARAGTIGALSSVAIGGVTDYVRDVRGGHMSWRRFAVERGADGVEGAVGAVAGMAAGAAAVAATAGSVLAAGTFAPVVVPVGAALIAGVAVSRATTRARHTITVFTVDKLAERRIRSDSPLPIAEEGAELSVDSRSLPTPLDRPHDALRVAPDVVGRPVSRAIGE